MIHNNILEYWNTLHIKNVLIKAQSTLLNYDLETYFQG